MLFLLFKIYTTEFNEYHFLRLCINGVKYIREKNNLLGTFCNISHSPMGQIFYRLHPIILDSKDNLVLGDS